MDAILKNKVQIEGLVCTPLRQINDERGAVLHMLRCDAADFTNFGECYFSEVLPGAIKAWKCHHRQTQNLAVPVGYLQMVFYDARESSTTRGTLQVIQLGRPYAYFRIRIPPGVWYGFSCLSTSPALLVNCSDMPHDPNESETRPFNDPLIPYDWGQEKAEVK